MIMPTKIIRITKLIERTSKTKKFKKIKSIAMFTMNRIMTLTGGIDSLSVDFASVGTYQK